MMHIHNIGYFVMTVTAVPGIKGLSFSLKSLTLDKSPTFSPKSSHSSLSNYIDPLTSWVKKQQKEQAFITICTELGNLNFKSFIRHLESEDGKKRK